MQDGLSLSRVARLLHQRSGVLIATALIAGCLAFGSTFLVAPRFEARVSLLPPQQQQGLAASALASLGGLGALAGGVAGLKTPADQYVGLMQSVSVADRLIAAFDLAQVYDEKRSVDVRRELTRRSRFSIGKRDGMIEIHVRDSDPQRAADIANRYVEELRLISARLAVSEAQQRRKFFDEQLLKTRRELTDAEQALGASGINAATMRVEPRAMVDSYARLRAEIAGAEVRLRALGETLAPTSAEVLQQQARLQALRAQLAALERSPQSANDSDYMERLREYKYREALFDVYARQFELARADEAREGALIQVVDPATAPERKVWPQRGVFTLLVIVVSTLLAGLLVVWRGSANHRAEVA
jgi:uncharacterized protein involved in exopolysaccharide biosynthesis